MNHDSEGRVFDISKPPKSPGATSRPMIVGHQPMMPDPMVREDEHQQPLLPTPAAGEGPKFDDKFDDKPELTPESYGSSAAEPNETSEPPQPPDYTDDPLSQPASDPSTLDYATPQPGSQFTPSDLLFASDDKEDTKAHDYHHAASPLSLPAHKGRHKRWGKRLLFWLGLLILLAMVAYAVLDSGLVKTDINLPFHLFKQEASEPAPVIKAPAPAKIVQSSIPAGFTEYGLPDTPISFAYPTAWGTPTVTAEPGFSKRGGSNKSDGTYAYLVDFTTNKDVQIAATSNKYLPVARAPLYYDYLKWCKGTNDLKFYKEILHFTTTNGVDTPTTITCDQGPLSDATRLDEVTILQLKTVGPDGASLGDLYTQSLGPNELSVLRIKDVAMSNGEDIRKLLDSVKIL